MPSIDPKELEALERRLPLKNLRHQFYHCLKTFRDRRFVRTLGQLCEYAGLDTADFTPAVKRQLQRRVSEVCTVQQTFVKGSVVVEMYDDTDDNMRWAVKNGAIAVVTTRQIDQLPCIVVEFPPQVYALMCRYFRDLREVSVTAVTGSIGKTTVKRMVNAVYSAQTPTFCNTINYNTLYQVGYFVQHIPAHMPLMVQEVSEGTPRYTSMMSLVLRPRVAIITKTDISHFEFFESEEAIVGEICDVCRYMPSDGVVIVNKDEFKAYDLLGGRRVVTVSMTDNDADFFAQDIKTTPQGLAFKVCEKGSGQSYAVALHNIFAPHNVLNALYAFAAGVEEKIGYDHIISGLQSFTMLGMRQNIITTPDGITVYADCYNAVPNSIKTAIEGAMLVPVTGKKVVVLGDIAELGDRTSSSHDEIIAMADAADFDTVVLFGEKLREAAARHPFRQGLEVKACDSHQEIATLLGDLLRKGDLLLLKGSHSAHLEKVIKLLWPATFDQMVHDENDPYERWNKMVIRS